MNKQKTSKKLVITISIILLLLVSSCTGWNLLKKNSSDYHLQQAEESLNKLETLLAAKEAGEEVDEELITELTAQILEETNAALEIAEENQDSEVINQINDFQTESLETFDEALTIIEDESIVDVIEDAINQIQEEQLELQNSLEEVVVDETTEAVSPSDSEGVLDVLLSSQADETAIEAVETAKSREVGQPEIPDVKIPAPATGNGNR